MNIFVLDENPIISARYLCDRHCVKMTLETSQLLCTIAQSRGFDAPYKPTHKNHPATNWLSRSSANWNWLCVHGLELAKEYTLRYHKIHKCQSIIQNMMDRTFEIWKENKSYLEHTPFVQCMPIQYKQSNTIEAYRNYYRAEKRSFAKWTYPSKTPEWF